MLNQAHPIMWININKNIFEQNDFKGFNHLFHLLTYRPPHTVTRYHVIIDSRRTAHLDNYKNLSAFDKQLIDQEYAASVITGAKPKYEINTQNRLWYTFNIEEGIRYFSQPAAIILENNKNDSPFIQAVVTHFEEISQEGFQTILEFLKNNWISFEHAGGCGNVMNYIDGKMAGFRDLAERNNKTIYHYLRALVILDSDKEYSAQKEKEAYTKLRPQLEEIKVIDHILIKRSMENYMPDEVIQELTPIIAKKWAEVYNYLSAEQKDYLNYSKGFSKLTDDKGVRLPLKTEVLSLYSLTTAKFNILDKGIGLAGFKENFPKYFLTSGRVNKYTLNQRAGSNELEVILTKIKTLI